MADPKLEEIATDAAWQCQETPSKAGKAGIILAALEEAVREQEHGAFRCGDGHAHHSPVAAEGCGITKARQRIAALETERDRMRALLEIAAEDGIAMYRAVWKPLDTGPKSDD